MCCLGVIRCIRHEEIACGQQGGQIAAGRVVRSGMGLRPFALGAAEIAPRALVGFVEFACIPSATAIEQSGFNKIEADA